MKNDIIAVLKGLVLGGIVSIGILLMFIVWIKVVEWLLL